MSGQPEPNALTESTLDLLESNFDGRASERVYDRCGEALCEQQDVRSLIAMARLSLTLQRRAEEAEARARAFAERLEAAELVLDLVHEIRDGGGALEPQLREHFDRWLETESKRVGEAFANLRSRKP